MIIAVITHCIFGLGMERRLGALFTNEPFIKEDDLC